MKAEWGNVMRFSLLFASSFPVMPKSFPVIFHKQFRQKSLWMLRLMMLSSSFQA